MPSIESIGLNLFRGQLEKKGKRVLCVKSRKRAISLTQYQQHELMPFLPGKNEFHYRRQEREDGKSKRREVAFPATGARILACYPVLQ